MLVPFLNIIQWKRLLYFSFVLFLFKYCFLYGYGFKTSLTFLDLSILTCSFSLLFAAGYLFNYRLTKNEKKNKFPVETAKKLALSLSFISLALGVYVSIKIEKPLHSFIFAFGIFLTFVYSKTITKKSFLNNLIQSFLIPFAIICLWWFDTPINLKSAQWDLFYKLELTTIIYAFVSFLSNLVRVLVIDIKDIDKDHYHKHQTIPILLGRKRAKSVVLAISIFICFFVFSLAILLTHIKFISLTIIILATIPELYFIYQLLKTKSKSDYKKLYKTTNIVYLLGVLTIPVVAYYFKYVIN